MTRNTDTTQPAGVRSQAGGDASLVSNGVAFDHGDAQLLRSIERAGSVAQAAESLGRSRARMTKRIDTLEEAFGPLVRRNRGGAAGGGSELTEEGIELLRRFDRFVVAIDATASVPETVLTGTIVAVDGELATVQTEIGEIGGLHNGLDEGDHVQARISADAITIQADGTTRNPETTSARNHRTGVVTSLERGERIVVVDVEVNAVPMHVLITDESVNRLSLEPGSRVQLHWKATATIVSDIVV